MFRVLSFPLGVRMSLSVEGLAACLAGVLRQVSNWLNLLPLLKYGFDHKECEFKTGINILYG